MSSKTHNIAEFYHQLALLIRSGLPLPEGIARVASQYPNPKFQEVLKDVSNRLDKGEVLSSILTSYPEHFPNMHVKMIKAGESLGGLGPLLLSLADFTRFNVQVVSKLKESLAYPITMIWVGLLATFVMMVFFVYPSKEIIEDMLVNPWTGESELRFGVSVAFWSADIIYHNRTVILFGIGVLLFVFLLLYSPLPLAGRLLERLARRMPGAAAVYRSMALAQCSAVLEMGFQKKQPLIDSLSMAAGIVRDPRLAVALFNVAAKVEGGVTPSDAFDHEPHVDKLIGLSLRNVPEESLADEFSRLKDIYFRRALLSFRAATVLWSMLAITFMVAIVILVFQVLVVPYSVLSETLDVLAW